MKKSKTEILYGIHPVCEALRAGRRTLFKIYIARDKKPKRFEKVVAAAQSKSIPVKQVDTKQLASLAKTDQHQGLAAAASPYPLTSISDILSRTAPEGRNRFLLLLDHIVDPQNLGALVRTALCVGIDGIVIPKDRSAWPTPAVSKASAGALEHTRLARVTNLTGTVKDLKASGLWIAGLDITAEQSIFSSDMTGPLALIVGGEAKGIRPLVKKQCDILMVIPQVGHLNSLNASAAGAVAMYEAFRQRNRQ